jgi:hypothetical protein
MTTRTPSHFQQNIFNAVQYERWNMFVDAVAGSGKTTTLEEICKRLTPEQLSDAIFLAFNKAIQVELAARLPREVWVKTFHAFAMGELKRALKPYSGNWIDDSKYGIIIRNILDERGYAKGDARSAIDDALYQATRFARLTLVNLDSDIEFEAMCRHYDIEELPGLRQMTSEILERGERCSREVIDFTDMIYLPIRMNISLRKFSFVMVDEAQDLSACQRELVRRMMHPNSRAVFVGDPHQCQPGYTKVLMQNGEEKRLSDVKVGDRVVGYARREGVFNKSSVVTEVSSRLYEGDIYFVRAGGKVTEATDNHKWLVRWNTKDTSLYCTYLMCKGTKYRVGCCQMFTKSGDFHLASRCRIEKADAAWLLGVYETRAEAFEQEQIASAKFGLPQVVFNPTNVSRLTIDENMIERIYDSCLWTLRAGKCLEYYGRDIQFPLYDKEERKRQGRNTVFVTESTNLVSDLMSVPVWVGDRTHASWEPLRVKVEIDWSGDVYSLDVYQHHTYVADGILTHNCIYGFAGAAVDSVDRIIEEFDCTVMPLSVCYRCPSGALDLAREIVPHIEAREGAPAGDIKYIQYADVFKSVDASRGDLVMCRTNSPLVELAFELLAAGIPATIKGRDLLAQLVNLAKSVLKLPGANWEQFHSFLQDYVERQSEALGRKKGTEMQIQALQDRSAALGVIVARAQALDHRITTINGLENFIERLYGSEKGAVVLSSVHKAKGLEAHHTFILGYSELMPHRMAQSSWAIAQEQNLRYVSLTRGKQALTFVALKPKEV